MRFEASLLFVFMLMYRCCSDLAVESSRSNLSPTNTDSGDTGPRGGINVSAKDFPLLSPLRREAAAEVVAPIRSKLGHTIESYNRARSQLVKDNEVKAPAARVPKSRRETLRCSQRHAARARSTYPLSILVSVGNGSAKIPRSSHCLIHLASFHILKFASHSSGAPCGFIDRLATLSIASESLRFVTTCLRHCVIVPTTHTPYFHVSCACSARSAFSWFSELKFRSALCLCPFTFHSSSRSTFCRCSVDSRCCFGIQKLSRSALRWRERALDTA